MRGAAACSGRRNAARYPSPGSGAPCAPERFFYSRRPQGEMARGEVRVAVTLACEDCKRRNYQTNKSRRNTPDRIELRKFCRWCGRHTPHKETR